MLAVLESATGENDWHVLCVVSRGVAQIGRDQHHRMIKQRAISVLGFVKPTNKLPPRSHLGFFDNAKLRNLFFVAAVVAQLNPIAQSLVPTRAISFWFFFFFGFFPPTSGDMTNNRVNNASPIRIVAPIQFLLAAARRSWLDLIFGFA